MYESELQALRQNQGESKPQAIAKPADAASAQPQPPQTAVPIKLSDSTFQMDNLAQAPQSNRATDDAYADMSVNKDLHREQ